MKWKLYFARGILVFINALLVFFSSLAQSTIVYTGSSSSSNNALPTNGSAGTITINKPAGTVTGQALIATLSARPRNTTVTVPSGWILMTRSEQTSGGSGTAPGGMTLLTYYRIVGAAEPNSYSWTFANPSKTGGSVVGGILGFTGIDTSSGSPINVWSQKLTASGSTHSTNSITPTKPNTMLVSSITYLSGSSFANPTGVSGITERIDQRAPSTQSASGTTLQMSTAPWATASATGSVQATIEGGNSYSDSGIGHIMALESSEIDPAISIALNSAIIAGGTGFYTLSILNNGSIAEPGPLTVTNTLPTELTYNPTGSGGTGWACNANGQVITCTRSGSLAANSSASPITINFNVSSSATGSITNTASITGTGGDGNTANNTDSDTTTVSIPAYTNIATYHFDEYSWNGTNGEIIDSTVNSYHASAAYWSGSSYPFTANSDRAISGSTGTCGYGVFTNKQYVSLPSTFPNLIGSFTIAAWFNTDDASRLNQRIFSDDLNNSGGYGLTLNDGKLKRLKFFQRNPDNSTSITTSFQSNTWYFVAVTVSGGETITIYLYDQSGNLLASESGTHSNESSYDSGVASIGNEPAGSSEDRGFYGKIDEVSLYSGALTATEIATLSQAIHACPSYSVTPNSFNCVATSADAATGHLYTQLAGTTFNYDVVALNASNAVESSYAAASNQNVTVEFVDGSGSTACASRSALNPAISQTVTFSASDAGRKSASVTISKAYQNLRCRVTDSNSTTVTTCSSDNFAVRPTNLTISSSNANADSTGTGTSATPVIKAGSSFALTATADVTGYNGTPSIDTSKLSAHSGGTTIGSLSGSFNAANASTGVATGSAFNYSEVGYFRLAANGIYDSTFTAVDSANGDCTTGFNASSGINTCSFGNISTTAYFGRFIPDHFTITAGSNTEGCNSGDFTYFGQDGLTTSFTITAQNSANATTQNYTGSFAKLGLNSWSNFLFSGATLPASSSLSASVTAPTGSWSNGVASVSAKHIVSRPTSATAPTSITISAAPTDSDGVTVPTATAVSSATPFRYGRLWMSNVYGSELLNLTVPIEAQYWSSNGVYQRNQLDSCTAIAPANIAMGSYKGNLTACETVISDGGTMAAGKTTMTLSKPGNGNNGSVDLSINLNSAAGSTCTSTTASSATSANLPQFGTTNPSARETFGLFKSPVIYMRENY